MKLLQELRKQLATKRGEMDAIVAAAEKETRALNAEEVKKFDGLKGECDGLQAQIKRLEDHEATRAVTPAPSPVKPETPGSPEPTEKFPTITAVKRYGKLRAFRDEQAAYRAGQWLRADVFGHADAAQWCRDHGVQTRAMTGNVNTAGGYLVPEEFVTAIIDNREQYGVFRQNTRVIPMGRDQISIPKRQTSITAYYVGENTAPTAAQPVLGQINLVARKLATLTQISSELAEDAATSIVDFLATDIASQFAEAEDQAAFNGDGTSTYGGIYGIGPRFEAGTTGLAGWTTAATAAHDTIAEITLDDIIPVMGKIQTTALANAKWYMSSAMWARVAYLAANAGGSTTLNIASGIATPALFGYPVIITQVMRAALSTDYTNLVIAVFGDLSRGTVMGDRRNITVAVDTSYGFNTDSIYIRATQRFDIAVTDLGASSTAAGPIAVLAGGTS